MMRRKILSTKDYLQETSPKTRIASMRKEYESKNIKADLLDEYVQRGWEVTKKNAKRIQIKKRKPIMEIGFNKACVSLYDLGFKILPNADNNLEDFNSDQFAFEAIDEEVVLIAYYFYSEKERTISNFKEKIDEIKTNLPSILSDRKAVWGKDKKYKIVFITKQYVISKEDEHYILDNNFICLNEERLEYYNNLSKHLGNAARYQFLGNLFAKQKITNLDEKIPAIRGEMGGKVYYSFSIEPEKLLKIGYILHRNDANRNDMPTYQRLIKKTRLSQIEEFIEKGGFFPNSIIISIDTNQKGLKFDLANKQCDNSICKLGLLYLPQRYKSVYIIDGQHRLYGYANTKYRKTNTVPVVAFLDLEKTEQVKLFMEINENQKSVSKNLRNTLNSDLLWDSNDANERNIALYSALAQELGEDTTSPLFDHIIIGENAKTEKTCITIDAIREGLEKSGFFNKYDKSGKLVQAGILDFGNNETNFYSYLAFLKRSFNYVKMQMKDEWEKGEANNGFLTINVGIYALIKIFADILKYLKEKGEILDNFDITGDISVVYPYLNCITSSLTNLELEKKVELKKTYGGNGKTKYWRTLQGFIIEQFNDFSTKDYEEWKLNNSKMFNEESFKMIRDIEQKLNKDFKSLLEKQYGAKWQILGVPKKVMQEAQKLAWDKRYENPDKDIDEWTCLHLINYREIAVHSSNWSNIFEKIYADPWEKKRGKDDKTKWMYEMNRIRNENDHTYSVTEEEYKFIKKYYDWLINGII